MIAELQMRCGKPRSVVAAVALLAAIGCPAIALAEPATASDRGFVSKALVAVGRLPADLRDKFGETAINASGMAVDSKSWQRVGDGYRGMIFLLPDRGWNTTGTIDYRPRVHKVSAAFDPAAPGTGAGRPLSETVEMKVIDTILLTEADGQPLTDLVRLEATGCGRPSRTAAGD